MDGLLDTALAGSVGRLLNDVILVRVVAQLERCRHPTEGGYSGGLGQIIHYVTTYATVLALVIVAGTIGTAAARSSLLLIRPILSKFLDDCRVKRGTKLPTTGFHMHRDGKDNVQDTYTVITVASLLQLYNFRLLPRGVPRYAKECRTYKGGFVGEPWGIEAHGGYTFYAVTALQLMGELLDRRHEDELRA